MVGEARHMVTVYLLKGEISGRFVSMRPKNELLLIGGRIGGIFGKAYAL